MKPAFYTTYLDKRLEQWGLWAIGRHMGSSVCMTGLIEQCQGEFIHVTHNRIPINPDAEEIEYIITHYLPPDHKAVLVQQYIMHGSISQKCRRLGCSRPTYYNRIRLAMFRVQLELESKHVDIKRKVQKCAHS